MVERQIQLDEDASLILDSISEAYGGNPSLAISELLRANEMIESFLDDLDASDPTKLEIQKQRAERGFREGRSTSWDEVKSQNGL
jgi:hypothetical protein